MVWIKADSSLAYHTKLDCFAEAAGIERAEAVGHLMFLWWWCAENAPTGVLPKMTNWEISSVMKYRGNETLFVQGLIASGFIDKVEGLGLKIHDWDDHVSPQVHEKLKYEKKKFSGKARVNSREIPGKFPGNSREKKKSGLSLKPLSFKALKTETLKPLEASKDLETAKEKPKQHQEETQEHVEFMDRFKVCYESMAKEPFSFRKEHFVIVHRLIKQHGYEAAVQKVKTLGAMCRDRVAWFTKGGWADFRVEILSRHWNSIIPNSAQTPETELLQEIKKREVQRERANELIRRDTKVAVG